MGWAYGELGEALRSLDLDDEAEEALDRALEIDSNNSFALGTKGQILREKGEHKDALPLLQHAVEIDPNSAWIKAELGAALYASNRIEEALRPWMGLLRSTQENYSRELAIQVRVSAGCSRVRRRRSRSPRRRFG